MPTPLTNRLRRRIEALEGRCLLSGGLEPADPIVVTGTDAHDVITLTRLDEHRVAVSVQSFLDPGWTRPTADAVVSYEIQLTDSTLASSWVLLSYPAQRGFIDTTGSIRVEAGAGNDRVEVVDRCGQPYFVNGTHRTDDPTPDPDGGVLVLPWLDDTDNRWLYAHDVWTQEIREQYTGTLVEGIDMAEGAGVGVRFHGIPVRSWTEWVGPFEPICPDPPPGPPDGSDDVPADPPSADEFLSGDGLGLLVGEDEESWPDTGSDAGAEGDVGADWLSDEPDPWAEWADDLPIEGESDYDPADGDASADGTDEWLETGLEDVAG